MNVGAVRKIIEAFKIEIEKIANRESLKLSQQLNDLFDDLNDNDLIDKALGLQVKNIIMQFWEQASQWPITDDWATNATVSAWLKLQDDLRETEWEIQVAHHGYFYHCWELQYDQNGNGVLAANQFMPVLIRCCRMLGYAEKQEEDYPFSRLTSKIEPIEDLKKSFLIDSVKSLVTSLTVLFYLYYRYCSPTQLTILPHLIKYRINTTDEERRSEMTVVNELEHAPQKALIFFRKMAIYMEGREFFTNPDLKNLRDLIPSSKIKLLEEVTDKQWYYLITHAIRTEEQSHLVDPLIKILGEHFVQQKDQSYPAALSFTEEVIRQFTHLSPLIQTKLVSALHYFCLEHYTTLCNGNAAKSPLFWFSPATKSGAALKLQQRERGISNHLSLVEWAATLEGRLNDLITLFDDYKKDIEAHIDERHGI